MLHVSGLVFVSLYLAHCVAGDVFCNKEEVELAWKICERAYHQRDRSTDIKEICSNMDCLIQCKFDAVGDCTKSDKFLDQMQNYDPEKWKVVFRILCSDVTFATEQRELGCVMNGTFCSSYDLSKNFFYGRLNLYNNGKYDEYKELLCNTTAVARDCLRVFPTANCSESSARISLDIVKTSSSLSFCDNKDIKHLYTKHGGDAKCANPKLDSKCFTSSLGSRVSRCRTFSLHTLVDQRLSPNIDEFCNSRECNIKCYEDAVSDCDKQEKYFNLDPVAVKVANRAACDNKEELKTAVKECSIRNTTCSTEFNKSRSGAFDFLLQQNYTEYRQAMCSATSKFIECLDYVVAGKCTDEMATLLKDMITVTFSYSKCSPQNHAFFSKHGADTYCVASGSGNPLLNIFLSSIIMLLLALLYK
ncbi:uncharacterized protein LOC123564903 [Mercenaria mercenaria]|uniref:uncharacterized protein LOC123564903 n=1 Tax=Mercenaria mercenaria TaxID=6596 RepID=UPI00234F5462|nr:uncharacterized protein LOC123564903 [Mercenaria mercenaria]